MVWRAEDPQGNEAAKCIFDVVPYLGESGFDLGCGPHKVFDHFVGIDSGIDSKLFGIPMKPDFVVRSCTRMPMFAAGATDTVFSSHLLEHVEDYRAALREWWRLVAVGGHLILYLPHRELYPNIGQPGANPDHRHDFHPDDIVAAMRDVARNWDLVHNETRDQGREYSFLQVYRKLPAKSGQRFGYLEPKPEKTVCIVRPGANGDALWGGAVAAAFKRDGYHVTMMTGPAGAEVLRADPNIDRIITLRGFWFSDDDWVLFYLWHSKKYDRFVNLIGGVETHLLPHPNEPAYTWPAAVRHARMNRNYAEAMFEVAQLPLVELEQRFHPTPAEAAWSREQRAKLFPGPLVVVAPSGTGLTKTWPHVQAFIDRLAREGVYSVVLGDLRQELTPPATFGCVLGMDLPIRHAMALALEADVVVGVESALLNAVATADNVKVALLSHSSAENLTKHWRNVFAVEATGVACHPCHRLHRDFTFCAKDPTTGFAACQSAASADSIADAIAPVLEVARARLQLLKRAA